MSDDNEEESWYQRNFDYVIGCSLLAAVAIIICICLHFERVQRNEHEAKCLKARSAALECMDKDKNNDEWHCIENAKIRFMCTQWPSSWEGR